MKKSEIQQLKNKPLAELQKQLVSAYDQLRKLKFDLSQGKVKNIKSIKEAKKMIARIQTILKAK